MCIADTDDEAKRHMGEGLRYFYEVLGGGPRTAARLVMQKTRYYRDMASAEQTAARRARLRQTTVDEAVEGCTILCGSPDTVIKQIERLKDELGNGVLNITMKVGNIPEPVIKRGMELFRDRVYPAVNIFRTREGQGGASMMRGLRWAALMAVVLLSGGALAQGAKNLPAGVAALLPDAKAEGYTATIYGQSLNPDQIADFGKRMGAFYGVPVDLMMISGLHPQKASQIVQGAKMGADSGIDIFWTGSAIAGTLERGGVVAPFDWVKSFGLDDSLRWGQNGLRAHDGTLATVIYNTDLIKPDEAPKTYEDLVKNPKWKGRIALPRAPNVFIYISYAIGDEPAQKLLKDLMDKQEAKILPTYPDVRNRVGTGEFAIGVGIDAFLLQRKGAPVDHARIEPAVLTPWGFWLMKDAKKPATGKLFAYWATTPDGQKALSEINGTSLVTTPGTELAKLAEGKKVVLVPHDFMVDVLPEKLPTYGAIMGIR